MNNNAVQDWIRDEVTIHIKDLLVQARQMLENELLSYGPETTNLDRKYFYLRGKIEGIDLFLEADLEETING